MVGQADDDVLAEDPVDRILDRQIGVLVDDPEYVRQGFPDRLMRFPSCQVLGDRVEEGRASVGIGGDDGVADAGEHRREPLLAGFGPPACGVQGLHEQRDQHAAADEQDDRYHPRGREDRGGECDDDYRDDDDQGSGQEARALAAVPGTDEHGQEEDAAESFANLRNEENSDGHACGEHGNAIAQRRASDLGHLLAPRLRPECHDTMEVDHHNVANAGRAFQPDVRSLRFPFEGSRRLPHAGNTGPIASGGARL